MLSTSVLNDTFNNNNDENFVTVCRNESIIPQFAPALVDASIPVIMSLGGCSFMLPETTVLPNINVNTLTGQKIPIGVSPVVNSNEIAMSSTTSVISSTVISNDVNSFRHIIEEESPCSLHPSTSVMKSTVDDEATVSLNAQSGCILTPMVVDLSVPVASTSGDYNIAQYSTLTSTPPNSSEITEAPLQLLTNSLNNNNCGTIEELNKAVITLTCENSRRMAVRRRHSLQQKDEEASCRSTMAATADEAIFFEPSTKFLKADSPGEACNGLVY